VEDENMIEILADAEMAKQLEVADGPVHLINDQGKVIAVCTPVKFPHSPYSREEVERIRQRYRDKGEGKPLTEILKRLEQLEGEGA
jgi:hypothetical protein